MQNDDTEDVTELPAEAMALPDRDIIRHKRGKKALIMVLNFRVLGTPAGHYCNRIIRGKLKDGFLLRYSEFQDWTIVTPEAARARRQELLTQEIKEQDVLKTDH